MHIDWALWSRTADGRQNSRAESCRRVIFCIMSLVVVWFVHAQAGMGMRRPGSPELRWAEIATAGSSTNSAAWLTGMVAQSSGPCFRDPPSLSELDIRSGGGGVGEGDELDPTWTPTPQRDQITCGAELTYARHGRFLSACIVPITHPPANKTAMSPVDECLRIDPTSMLACTWQALQDPINPHPRPGPL